ncbi:MAG: DMT family transporter, partial [Candidatus Dormibacteraeota bacterium]|nr:DMT family transporter [Candidatus Dormibacteraeota bacterium]
VYLAWTLWSWVQSRVGVSRPAVFMYLVPIIAAAVSWLLLREAFGPLKVLGALVVIAGVALSRVNPRRVKLSPVPATNSSLAAN